MKFPQFDSPTTIIIFGATGDLSQKKLLSALFHMYKKDELPTIFRVVGLSRDAYSDEEFRTFAKETLHKNHTSEYTEEELETFISMFRYQQGVFEDPAAYQNLTELLHEVDNSVGRCMNKMFYLAVAPAAYKIIFQNIANSRLTIPCSDNVGWTRVLVEKPFGKDLETAQELDMLLGRLFEEKQIFRIDHYLAKDTLRDILTFRFSNTMFEPIWNNQWIEKMEIRLWEDIDIAARGSFYNDVGALRDVGQNHMLQMLSLVTMNHPGSIHADDIRAQRVEIMKNLRVAGNELQEGVIRGQYEGFSETAEVPSNSETETYFKLKTYVDTERWAGVPFYLESGKALADKTVEIVVTFKSAHPCLCGKPHDEHTHQNTITFSIQPVEKITVRFWSKRPGIVSSVLAQDLSFDYATQKTTDAHRDAYEKVLFDCIAGDQTLFASTDEVTASWAFITPILKNWHQVPLEIYARGSSGPERVL